MFFTNHSDAPSISTRVWLFYRSLEGRTGCNGLEKDGSLEEDGGLMAGPQPRDYPQIFYLPQPRSTPLNLKHFLASSITQYLSYLNNQPTTNYSQPSSFPINESIIPLLTAPSKPQAFASSIPPPRYDPLPKQSANYQSASASSIRLLFAIPIKMPPLQDTLQSAITSAYFRI
jgi:hypothetical protein